MQFQVPQNIDLEDKIIGPLTLKQFIILLVGGMFDYIWYTFLTTGLFILLAIPTTLFTLALVFARVHEEPFPKFLASLFLFVIKPKILTWGETLKPKIIETKKAKKEQFTPKITSGSEIEKLSRMVDTQGWGGSVSQPSPKTTKVSSSPITQVGAKSKSLIKKMIPQKKPPQQKPKPVPKKIIQPSISQPQPIIIPEKKKTTPVIQPAPKPTAPSPTTKPIISSSEIKKIVKETAKKEKLSYKKTIKAAQEITKSLKKTPPEKIKPKTPFWKKIIEKLPKTAPPPQAKTKPSIKTESAPAETTEKETPLRGHILATEILSPEDMEKELGLGSRVKSHEAIKPKINLGPDSENVPEDPLEKVNGS